MVTSEQIDRLFIHLTRELKESFLPDYIWKYPIHLCIVVGPNNSVLSFHASFN